MNTTPLTTIAPEVFRKRLLVEGYFGVEVTEDSLRDYFSRITSGLKLRTYGEPNIHKTSGAGKDANEGFDGFVPLIDSGNLYRCLGEFEVSFDDYLHLRRIRC